MRYLSFYLLAFFFYTSQLEAHGGFYAGGSVGGHLAEATQTGFNFTTGGDTMMTQPLQKDLFEHGATGMLYVGYGFACRRLYLGGEVFAQFGSAGLRSNDRNADFNIDPFVNRTFISSAKVDAHIKDVQFGGDLLPGFLLNPGLLLYGRVGVGAARTSIKADANLTGSFQGEMLNTPLHVSKKKDRATFRAGGGIEQQLSKRISIRADYIYTDFGHFSVADSVTTIVMLLGRYQHKFAFQSASL